MCVTTKKPLTLQNVNKKMSHLLFAFVWYLPHTCTCFTVLSYTVYQKVVTLYKFPDTHYVPVYREIQNFIHRILFH